MAGGPSGIQIGFLVSLIAHAYVGFYGWKGHKIGRKPADAPPLTSRSNNRLPARKSKRSMNKSTTLLFLASFLVLTAVARAQVEYVDPTIGGVGFLLEPTRPTVHLPNSMVRVYPVRKDQLDDQIQSFPLTIISHRLGELFSFMPCDGAPDGAPGTRPQPTIRNAPRPITTRRALTTR